MCGVVLDDFVVGRQIFGKKTRGIHRGLCFRRPPIQSAYRLLLTGRWNGVGAALAYVWLAQTVCLSDKVGDLSGDALFGNEWVRQIQSA